MDQNESSKAKAWKYAPVLVVVLSLFLLVQTVNALKEYRYIGGGGIPENVITVSGDGEMFAAPDIATFSFSIIEEGNTVKEAQDKASVKMNAALEAVEALGIEDRDVQTTGFNAYPRYEYTETDVMCVRYPCPPVGRQEIVGYEVNQTVTIKVRNVDGAGDAIDAVTTAGASNVSGISFTIDNEDDLIREARQQAIDKAREKAEELADDLGVDLVRIVSFSENGNYPMPFYAKAEASLGRGSADMAMPPSPSLPTGENRLVSNVTITYEIR